MLKELMNGTLLTLALTLLALFSGFCLALMFTYLLATKKKFYVAPIRSFISFSRGVPLLIQIYLMYYGCAEFDLIQNSILWPILQHPFYCATIVLSLNSAAYTTVLFENDMNSIPKGELENCKILNLSFFQTMRHIVFPKVLSNVWPTYSNEVIMVLKSTSLASTITLIDLMGAARQMIAISYQTFEILIVVSIIYLLLAVFLVGVLMIIKNIANGKVKCLLKAQ